MPYWVELVWSRLEGNSVKNIVVGVYNMVYMVTCDCVHLL